MTVTLAVLLGVLTTAGVALLLERSLARVVLGLGLLGHVTVLFLLATSSRAGQAPLAGAQDPTDPLPQALGLTAIVISFGLTVFVLALAARLLSIVGDDVLPDDPEDRRVAAAGTATVTEEATP